MTVSMKFTITFILLMFSYSIGVDAMEAGYINPMDVSAYQFSKAEARCPAASYTSNNDNYCGALVSDSRVINAARTDSGLICNQRQRRVKEHCKLSNNAQCTILRKNLFTVKQNIFHPVCILHTISDDYYVFTLRRILI